MGPRTARLQDIHREAAEVVTRLRSAVSELALEGRAILVVGADLEGLPEAGVCGEETLCELLDAQWSRFQEVAEPWATHRLGGRLVSYSTVDEDVSAAFAAVRDALAKELARPILGVPSQVPLGCVVWREVVRDQQAAEGAVERIVDIGEFSRSKNYRSLSRLLSRAASFQEVAELSAEALTMSGSLAAVEIDIASTDIRICSGTPFETDPDGEIQIPAARDVLLRWWFGDEEDRGAHEDHLRRMSLAIQAAVDRVDAAASALHAAEHDDLTGLLNRAGLRRRLQLSGRPFVVGVVDLDRLKVINDTHGHAAGDRAICRVARSLSGGRATDLVARWGGEEFVVVLFDSSPRDAADWLRGRLRELRVESPSELVSFSGGTSACDGPGDFDRAFAAADSLAYRAKADGRSRVYADGDEP